MPLLPPPSPASHSRERAIAAGPGKPAFEAGRLPASFSSPRIKASARWLKAAADIAIGALLGSALTLVVLAADIPAKARMTWGNVEKLFGLEVVCEQGAVDHLVCTWSRREQP